MYGKICIYWIHKVPVGERRFRETFRTLRYKRNADRSISFFAGLVIVWIVRPVVCVRIELKASADRDQPMLYSVQCTYIVLCNYNNNYYTRQVR